MHAEFDHAKEKDVGGGVLTSDEKPSPSFDNHLHEFEGMVDEDGSQYSTQEEIDTLRHVPFTLPARTWLVCVIELSERFCYYGVSGVFNNYISNPYGSGAPYTGDNLPGAIGRGSAFASGLQNFWQFWCYGESHHIALLAVADRTLQSHPSLEQSWRINILEDTRPLLSSL